MKKRYLPIALLATAALGLAACSSSAPADGGKVDGDGQSLKVWIMQGTNPNSEDFFAEVGKSFKEETGADLKVEYVQWADAHDRFVTSIAGGTTPDVAETGTTWTAEFADAGALAPITEYVDKAGLKDDLVEGLVKSGTYDGELYGMPWYAGVRAMVYRSDVFDELGIKVPTNWAEIEAAVATIKAAKPDMIPFPVPGDAEFQVYPWVWGAGGEVATEKDGTWTSEMDSAKSREGLEFYTGLATEHGSSTSGATTWKETDVLDNFTQGKVAMSLQGSWTPATIIQKAPELEGKFAATPIPGKDGGISPSVLGGSHLSMFNTSKNKELAFKFIEMMGTGKYAEKWAEQTGYFPGQTSLLDDAQKSDNPLVKPFAEQMVNGGASVPVTPTFGAVQAKKTTNAMIQSILSGSKTVEQASTDAAKEMTGLLNDKK
ncbi:sugar ABC transporter substrate-binding protein [Mycetocola spongiae]|uniref:sugar ABC transporter substrate-binding protein n=1 Tax=Mycetocola spongiae TaxID=2859226 RepID=UPI001CF52A37|nr:sugar ABC transporter substrate-binding protein [Mycetocola spongiae]UCR88669.1 sugar ABC transporter substrate-binding protein [Mycetocola spongiae]